MNLTDKDRTDLAKLKAKELVNVFYTLTTEDILNKEQKKSQISCIVRTLIDNKSSLYSAEVNAIIDEGMDLFHKFMNNENPAQFVKFSKRLNRELEKEIKDELYNLKSTLGYLVNDFVISEIYKKYY